MMILRVGLLLLCGAEFILQEKLTLSPAFPTALENTSLELTCNAPVGTNRTQWGTINRPTFISYLTVSKDGSCLTVGSLMDTKYFETECNSNGTFKVKIKEVNLSHHGQAWYCLNNPPRSNTVNISVQVPVKYVELENVSGSVLNVIENINTPLTCLTSEGRPYANITWTKKSQTDIENDVTHNATYNVSKTEILSEKNLTIVKSSIQIFPTREDNNSLIICRAKNGNFTGVEKYATLNVQYPPNKPMFFVNEWQTNGSVLLMFGSNVSIHCKSDSYPSPTYHWNSTTGRSEDGPYLKLSNLDKNQTWQCTSTNNMTIPNKTIPWESSANVTIDLFYPSEIDMFYVIGKESRYNVEATENETIIFHCSVNSIPKSEIVIYFAEKELGRNEYSHTLNKSVRVTSCLDDGVYICEAKNQYNSQPSSKELRLSVKCSVERLYFMISEIGLEGKKFIVNTNEEVSFMCFTCNDLPFDIGIRRQDGTQLTLMKNTTSVGYKIHKVSCNDAGIYACSAKEPHLSPTRNTISKLTLIVKCPPAPPARYKGDEAILSVLHSDVTLHFEVLRFFDEKINTVFTWYKQNISLPNDGRKYIITSNGFQSNVIIKNIAATDFGQYKVVVFNSYGQYIHHFELEEKEQITRILLVVVGTFGFIIVVGVVVAIRSRRIRQRRSDIFEMEQIEMSTDAVENQIPSIEDDNADDAHYQEINVYEHLDQQLTEREDYVEMQSVKSEDSNKYYITPIHQDQQLTEREDYVEMQSIESDDSNKYYITPIHY